MVDDSAQDVAVLAPGLELPQPEQDDYELWMENVETVVLLSGANTVAYIHGWVNWVGLWCYHSSSDIA